MTHINQQAWEQAVIESASKGETMEDWQRAADWFRDSFKVQRELHDEERKQVATLAATSLASALDEHTAATKTIIELKRLAMQETARADEAEKERDRMAIENAELRSSLEGRGFEVGQLHCEVGQLKKRLDEKAFNSLASDINRILNDQEFCEIKDYYPKDYKRFEIDHLVDKLKGLGCKVEAINDGCVVLSCGSIKTSLMRHPRYGWDFGDGRSR